MMVLLVVVVVVMMMMMMLMMLQLCIQLSGSTDPYSHAPKSRSQVDGLVLSCTPDDTKSSPVVEQVVLLAY